MQPGAPGRAPCAGRCPFRRPAGWPPIWRCGTAGGACTCVARVRGGGAVWVVHPGGAAREGRARRGHGARLADGGVGDGAAAVNLVWATRPHVCMKWHWWGAPCFYLFLFVYVAATRTSKHTVHSCMRRHTRLNHPSRSPPLGCTHSTLGCPLSWASASALGLAWCGTGGAKRKWPAPSLAARRLWRWPWMTANGKDQRTPLASPGVVQSICMQDTVCTLSAPVAMRMYDYCSYIHNVNVNILKGSGWL